jgi:polysaccharide export outer membrane protein
MTLILRLLACVVSVFLTSCGAMPSVAPTATQLESRRAGDEDIYIVKVTKPVMRALAVYHEPGFPKAFQGERYIPAITLKQGDVVAVTIYESGGSTLFGAPGATALPGVPGPQSAAATTLPPQVIEADGRIVVPYIGRMSVVGLTPAKAATRIEQALSSQTVRPQVIVSLASNTSNTVSVGGEVNKAGLMQLTLRGERLLDTIAWAGGPKLSAAQLDIHLIRGSTVVSVPLRQVLANPADNIVIRPNDNVVLVNNPRSFVVMGATAKPSQYIFDTERVTFAEAIARGGGGIDASSNMAGVYLFRHERPDFARRVLSADAGAVDETFVRNPPMPDASSVPIMYRIDLKQADGYFFAQQVEMRDKDIVLIANAETTQIQKFLQLLRGVSGIFFDLSRASGYYAAQ